MPCLASISEVTAGTVLRNGFNTEEAAPAFSCANSCYAAASFSARSFSRQLCSTVAEIFSTSPQSALCRSSSQASVLSYSVVAASSRSAISCLSFSIPSLPFVV
jgi:hypothetical protein